MMDAQENQTFIGRERFVFLQKEWIYPFGIVLLGFIYYITYFDYGINLGDEGFLVYGAERVLLDQLPISDFTSYPPGSYFLLALFFKLFGVNLLVSRFMEIAFLLSNGLMVFHIGKNLMSAKWALIPSFILIVLPGPWYKVFFTFSLIFPLFTLLRFLEKKTRVRLLTVGWAVGVALILRFESGLLSLIAISVVLIFDSVWKEGKLHFDRKAVIDLLRNLLLCFFALLSTLIPLVIYYHYQSALGKLFHYLLIKESSFASAAQISELLGKPNLIKAFARFHVGKLHHLFFFLIVLLHLYVFGNVFSHLFIQKRKDFPLLLPVLIMGFLSLAYPYTVMSKHHLLSSAAVAYILFGFVVYSLRQWKGIKSNAVLVVLFVLLGLYFVDNFAARGHYFTSGSISIRFAIGEKKKGLISSSKGRIYVEKGESDVINGLVHFFQGKEGHLMPLYFEPMLNFLTGLQNPTRFSTLDLFYLNDTSWVKQVINDVERHKVKYLLIRRSLWTNRERGVSIYPPLVYELVEGHYYMEKEIGNYLVFSRR